MKKLLLSAAALLIAASTFAQTAEKAVKQYGFWDNWFFQVQLGASENFSENYKHANVLKVLSPVGTIGVGKYFSPEVGARLQFTAGQARNKYIPTKGESSYYATTFIGGNFDALFNLSNIFCQYNPNRVFNLIGIMGLGYEYGFKRNSDGDYPKNIGSTNTLSPRLGLAADFKVSDAVNVNIEANTNFDSDNFNGVVDGRKYDNRVNLLLGLTYKFPTRGFKVLDAVDPAEISALNNKINDQRSEIENLQNQLKNQPAPTNTESVVKKEVNSIVLFKIGQAKIEDNQKANLYYLAQTLKNNNQKVTVVGYADKGTGSAERNMKVSQERAESVSKALQELGVDASNITTDAKGDTEQPFANQNDWNRVVIITSAE